MTEPHHSVHPLTEKGVFISGSGHTSSRHYRERSATVSSCSISKMKLKNSHKHGYLLAVLQLTFFILFWIFVRYHPDADARLSPISSNATDFDKKVIKKLHKASDDMAHSKLYPMFQDVHVMIFIGFGFLMTFLKKYGFSAVGLNFLLASLSLQWAILVNGFFHLKFNTIYVDINSLLGADFVAAAVLISFGALLGKTTPTQLIIMTMIEIPIFAINEVIGRNYLGAIDMGDSMYVHAFGAYFGLAVSLMLYREEAGESEKEGSSYVSDIFAMIGTVFLWLYWPSFNSGAAPGDDQHRGVINTYISLAACTITAFAVSSIVDKDKKFNMVHIQNSTLAGGVAVGTAADLMVHPWGAALIGIIAGVISVLGYTYLTPLMASKLRIHDTCGVHNLHGMPAVLAGIIGCVAAAVATEDTYGVSLYQIFPARAPVNGTAEFTRIQSYFPDLEEGTARTAGGQAANQILALVISVAFAIVGGLITGFLLRIDLFAKLKPSDLYDDTKYWLLEEEEGEEHKSSVSIPMNATAAENGNK